MDTSRLTREGNIVAAADAPCREAMKGLCKTCVHCLDFCKRVPKGFESDKDFKWVSWCNGYEALIQPVTHAIGEP